ncbi:hypothetical protein RB614_10310 [Phytohabitans sp. ZYX-F-186]|uniref:FXSXX-COOH protein n=1 Tax=Phytohabitans maris TaxID=3071409 RepID=A0ABU0ZD68_9ACTN|nr:hypothetical protein [Phytohabitans sp. ZYX-F-186]MDQ7904913.1 hypothetical protein [Phytohabitans sp. ZYX-F-186]
MSSLRLKGMSMHEEEHSAAADEASAYLLPDLSKQALGELFATDDSALAACVQRLLRDMSRPAENYAAHGSTPDPVEFLSDDSAESGVAKTASPDRPDILSME